ncbi:triose-phosphate isomerase [Candidatus Microgenomates bacterium]|nr:MAG: triose-phosphate isomerase [Candidatus Microgenomates bacterium]
MIFINFKTYSEGTGQHAILLLEQVVRAQAKTKVELVPVVQASDIREATTTSLKVWAQHVDGVEPGAHTGFVLPEAVFDDGARGTFLNHSEHKFVKFKDLEIAHSRARSAGLSTLVFAADLGELSRVLALEPSYASYEPPELVGSKTTSVAAAKPEIIGHAAGLCRARGVPLIVGAGIKSEEDVRASVKLGAAGIAVASSIVLSENPEEEILKLAKGF